MPLMALLIEAIQHYNANTILLWHNTLYAPHDYMLCMHARLHVMHARTHTCMHTRMHTHACIYMYRHAYTHTYAHMYTRTHAYTQHTHTHIHTCTHNTSVLVMITISYSKARKITIINTLLCSITPNIVHPNWTSSSRNSVWYIPKTKLLKCALNRIITYEMALRAWA